MLGVIDNVSYKDICSYAGIMTLNKNKLNNHLTPVGKEDILKMYKDSLKL